MREGKTKILIISNKLLILDSPIPFIIKDIQNVKFT